MRISLFELYQLTHIQLKISFKTKYIMKFLILICFIFIAGLPSEELKAQKTNDGSFSFSTSNSDTLAKFSHESDIISQFAPFICTEDMPVEICKTYQANRLAFRQDTYYGWKSLLETYKDTVFVSSLLRYGSYVDSILIQMDKNYEEPTPSKGPIPRKMLPYFESIGEIGCDVSWDKWCEETYSYELPKGWQACALELSYKSKSGNNKQDVKPYYWFRSDTEAPPRFRGYKILLRADGNNEFLSPEKGKIIINKVRIYALEENAPNSVRKRANCHMPYQSTTKTSPLVTEPSSSKVPSIQSRPSVVRQIPNGEKFRVIIHNPGDAINKVRYILLVKSKGEVSWKTHSQGHNSIEPGATWDHEFHKYGAIDWKFTSIDLE